MYTKETINKIKKQGTDQVSLKNIMVAVFIRLTLIQQAPVEALGKEEAYQNVLFVRYSLTTQLYMLIFVFPYLVKYLVYLAPIFIRPPYDIFNTMQHLNVYTCQKFQCG